MVTKSDLKTELNALDVVTKTDLKIELNAVEKRLDQKFDGKFSELSKSINDLHSLLVKAILGMAGFGIVIVSALYILLERGGLL